MVDELKAATLRADPSALGLAALGVTTFLISLYNIVGGPDAPLVGFVAFVLLYGGLTEFLAGLFEYRTEDTFSATAYTTYGALFMALASFGALVMLGDIPQADITVALAWVMLAFAILNVFFVVASARINVAVFSVFLALEITEILLLIGYFIGEPAGVGLVAIGGGVGILTATLAWYAGGATMLNHMARSHELPVGSPLWGPGYSEPTQRVMPLREQHAGMHA